MDESITCDGGYKNFMVCFYWGESCDGEEWGGVFLISSLLSSLLSSLISSLLSSLLSSLISRVGLMSDWIDEGMV